MTIVCAGGPFGRLPAHKYLETWAAGEGGQGQGGGEDGPFLGHAGKLASRECQFATME